jgi:hypothetical protein
MRNGLRREVCQEERYPCGFAGDEEEDYWFVRRDVHEVCRRC